MRTTGGQGRENAGTSNRNSGAKPEPRKLEVSLAMEIIQGLVGPKAMTKVAVDGQLVNILVLLYYLMG